MGFAAHFAQWLNPEYYIPPLLSKCKTKQKLIPSLLKQAHDKSPASKQNITSTFRLAAASSLLLLLLISPACATRFLLLLLHLLLLLLLLLMFSVPPPAAAAVCPPALMPPDAC